MKKIISLLLAAALLLSVFAMSGAALVNNASSLSSVPEGYTAITTAAELNAVRNNLSGKYILMNDIDLSDFDDWRPIGTPPTPFTGIFDGNGYAIKNISSFCGVFLAISEATLTNICVINADIVFKPANGSTGAIVGIAVNSSISSCYAIGSVYTEINNPNDLFPYSVSAGGVVGSATDTVVENCYAFVDLSNKYQHTYGVYLGGIAGTAVDSSISYCYYDGSLSAQRIGNDKSTHIYKGGVLGISDAAVLKSCYFSNKTESAVGTGPATSQSIVKLNDADLMKQESFVGFDFENVWKMSSISGYPVFKTEKAVVREQIDIRYKEAASPFVHGEAEIVSWTAEPEGIAELDANGRIVGASAGSASIKLTLSDGTTASCKVNVSYSFIQWLIRIFLFGWIWY